MNWNEIATYAGVFVGTLIGGLIAYLRKKPAVPPTPVVQTDAVIAGVGLELGNRKQVDMLISELHRIGDILESKRTAGIEGRLKEILERMEEIESGQAPRRRR